MPTNQSAVDFDLKSWLSEISSDGSLSKEDVASLGTILGNEKVTSKLKDQFLMRSDYSRKTQELADSRRQVEQDINEILAERQDLAKWKGDVDAKLNKAYSDLDSERTTKAQFQARIQTIAEQNNLNVEDLMRGLAPARTATSTAAADAANNGAGNGNGNFDPTKYVANEDFSRFARQSPMLNAMVEDIFSEHQDLTGKPLRLEYTDTGGRKWTGRQALLVKTSEHNVRAGNRPMSVRDMWETDFKIADVRQQQLRSSIEGEVRGKLEAEYKTKLSEQMVNGTPGRITPLADRPKSPLFDDKRDHRLPAEREAAAASNGDNGRKNEPPPVSAANKESHFQKYATGYMERRAEGLPLGQDKPAAGKGGL